MIRSESKISFDECRNLDRLYGEYKERYKRFFESLVQKNDDSLKKLIFRLDFNEYYTDKYYQAYEFDFILQDEYKESNLNVFPSERSITSIEEIKDPFRSTIGDKLFMQSPEELSFEKPTITPGTTKIIRRNKGPSNIT